MRKTKNNYVPAEFGGYLFPKSCLPDILPGDRGKVLTVNQTETEAIWAQAQGGSDPFTPYDVVIRLEWVDGNAVFERLKGSYDLVQNRYANKLPVTIQVFNVYFEDKEIVMYKTGEIYLLQGVITIPVTNLGTVNWYPASGTDPERFELSE